MTNRLLFDFIPGGSRLSAQVTYFPLEGNAESIEITGITRCTVGIKKVLEFCVVRIILNLFTPVPICFGR